MTSPAIEPEILSILRCPDTRQELVHVSDEEIASKDGSRRYRFADGIYRLMPSGSPEPSAAPLRAEKEKIRKYYDEVGWKKDAGGGYRDLAVNRSPGPWDAYHAACALRLRDFLPPSGRFLLDAGSGPIAVPEYLTYHERYERRICVDLSVTALEGAREKLGDRGVYILGDLTNLPLADGAVDAAVSCNVIYHIPADEQAAAFEELARVLRPRGRAAVVYVWPKAPLQRLLKRVFKRIPGTRVEEVAGDKEDADYYIHPHSYEWFRAQPWTFDYEIVGYMLFGPEFARKYTGMGQKWESMMKWLLTLQKFMPHVTGRYGKYPLIIVKR